MTDLGAEIADCPKRHAAITERCDVYFPGLRKIMDPNGETPRSPAQDHGDDDDE